MFLSFPKILDMYQTNQLEHYIKVTEYMKNMTLKELEKLNLELHLSTDDGSAGLAGPLTEPLAEAVARDPDGMICACGPPGMLKAVGRIAASCGCRCQVAVETLMACGMGACQGCVLEQAGRQGAYLKVCRDGPVFDASRIIIPG